jgi:glutamine synthetase
MGVAVTAIALTERHRMPPVRVFTLAAAVDALAARDVSAVAVTAVDHTGVARATAIPVGRVADAAENGLRVPPLFVGASEDLRLRLDWSGLRVLSAQPGWAWAPADQVSADGEPFPGCQRSFLRRMIDRANATGLTFLVGCDLTWFLADGGDEAPTVESLGSAYSFGGLARLAGLASDLLDAFAAAGIEVSQFHRGLGAGEVELSLAACDPITAADVNVFARETIRIASARHGWHCSFRQPLSKAIGYGDRIRLSAWRNNQNLLADGDGGQRMTTVGEAFTAGTLAELPALVALATPTTGRASIRFSDGRAAGAACLANIEATSLDESANPHLAIGTLIAAGLAGIERELRLPPRADTPPTTLDAALDALEHSTILRAAMGPALHDAYMATRKTRHQLAGSLPPPLAAAAPTSA